MSSVLITQRNTAGFDDDAVVKASERSGLTAEMAYQILDMAVTLQTNEQILYNLKKGHDLRNRCNSLRRKISRLICEYILIGYAQEFKAFCKENGITVFGDKLHTEKKNSNYARMVMIVFLRETVLYGE